MESRLQRHVAIPGGSAGIGLATARLAAERGAKITLTGGITAQAAFPGKVAYAAGLAHGKRRLGTFLSRQGLPGATSWSAPPGRARCSVRSRTASRW
jgi:NAD(P)-dependent dehydrogenase (short-subunit alcohol dehydrogenase family)